MGQPKLSIVTPTREGFSQHWLTELLKVKGDVEFILVHPPGYQPESITEQRMIQIVSPIRGEIIQRLSGLFNARGEYILTINCDEYITPDILDITLNYFRAFPESWVLRLSRKNFPFGEQSSLDAPWQYITIDASQLTPMPIAPIDNKLDFGLLWRGRKDHHGRHTENFDKKIWDNSLVQPTISELAGLINLAGPLKYLPFWCLDRLLGLYIQAKFYESGKIIGHVLPETPEQLRIEENPPEYRKTRRFYFLAEILLIKQFPHSGYFWNLNLDQIRAIPLRMFGFLSRYYSKEMINASNSDHNS
ncbi:MAG: transposase [Gloeocapsa sp. DLM2.Bin57]|nr:MAG: transposase [Gloeocapsa sp. DLM2.Bin57]